MIICLCALVACCAIPILLWPEGARVPSAPDLPAEDSPISGSPLAIQAESNDAPASEPLTLPEPPPTHEEQPGQQFSGRVLDENGAPVTGLKVQADWLPEDEFGEPLQHRFAWYWYRSMKAVGALGLIDSMVRTRTAVTNEHGEYTFSGLPRIVHLWVNTDRYDISPAPTFWEAGTPCDWTATRLLPIEIELEPAAPAGTSVSATHATFDGYANISGASARVMARPGRNLIQARSCEFGLSSQSVWVTVSEDTPVVRLKLQPEPRIEARITFEGPILRSGFEVMLRSPDMPWGTSMNYQAGPGLWTTGPISSQNFEVCAEGGGRTLAKVAGRFTGGQVRVELSVPAPEDYCTVTSNVRPPADGNGFEFFFPDDDREPVVWGGDDGRWLLQAPVDTPAPQVLALVHPAWGTAKAEGDTGPGGKLHIEFQRPAYLRVQIDNCADRLKTSLGVECTDAAQQRTLPRWYKGDSVAVQPGKWTIVVSSSLVPGERIESRTIELAAGGSRTVRLDMARFAALKVRMPAEELATLRFELPAPKVVNVWDGAVLYVIAGVHSIEYESGFELRHLRIEMDGSRTLDLRP